MMTRSDPTPTSFFAKALGVFLLAWLAPASAATDVAAPVPQVTPAETTVVAEVPAPPVSIDLPAAPLSQPWQVQTVYGQGDQIHGVPRSFTILAVGEPLPQLKGFTDNADFQVERGPVADARQGDRPARAFRFLLNAKRAGACTLPGYALYANDLMQLGVPEQIHVVEPQVSDLMQLSVTSSAEQVFPGQALTVTVTWTTSIPLYAIKALRLTIPQLSDNALKIIVPSDPERETRKNAIGLPVGQSRMIGVWTEETTNEQTQTTVHFSFLMVPKSSGVLVFNDALLQCSVDRDVLAQAADKKKRGQWKGPAYPSYFNNDFFDPALDAANMERIYCTASVQPLIVKPFPVPPPANFSGIVGRPELTLTSSVATARVGDPVQVNLTVTHPDPAALELPPLDALGSFSNAFRLVDNRSAPTLTSTSAEYHQTIWPLRPDVGFIPPVIVTYFDPEQGRFREAESNPVPLVVEASVQLGALDGLTSDGKPLRNPIIEKADGLHANKWGAALLVTHGATSMPWRSVMWALVLLVPPIGVLAKVSWVRWMRYQQANAPQRRARTAHRRCIHQLRRLPAHADPREIVASVENYLRDRFNLHAGHIGFGEAGPVLTAAGLGEAELAVVRDWFLRQDHERFGLNALPRLEATEAIQIVDVIERSIR